MPYPGLLPLFALTLPVVVLAGACATSGGVSEGPTGTGTEPDPPAESGEIDRRGTSRAMRRPPPERVAGPSAEAPIRGEVPAALIEALLADLVERTGGGEETPELLRAEAVVWADGSLGCPRPDEVYTQALVPGYRVELALAGRRYDYRATESGHFRLCAVEPLAQRADQT